jgi:signal transduction histidine kinase
MVSHTKPSLQEELAAELRAMTRLHELSTRLLATAALQALLEEVLSATIELQDADFGNVQLYNRETGTLEIVAQRGFPAEFLEYFARVKDEGAACGRALHGGGRVIIEDVLTDPGFAPHRAIAASSGFRAVQSTPLFARSGEPLGMISTHFRQPHRPSDRDLKLTDLYARQATEMIELKRAEEALRRAHEELAHVTRVMSMGELTVSIAHEINQPLAAIVANAHAGLRWLGRDEPDLAEARTALERIVRDGARAGDIVGRIREFSQKTAPHKVWVDLNEVVHEVLPLAQSELIRYRASVQTELAPLLPRVLVDRVQLQQVILNLMMNGMEAMAAVDDRPRELLIASRRDGPDEVLLSVRDSGMGLGPHTEHRLLEAFFTTKPEGMGLGLSISQRIVEAHGGHLRVEANADHGVTIRVCLPTGGERVS